MNPDDSQSSPRPPERPGAPPPVVVTLPDGSRREFPGSVTGAELAAAIGPGLARAAVAVKIDGRPRDLAALIDHDASVAIITRDSPEGIEILRHDAAHVMAEAVKELYPETQVTFGPSTETGFYYDFARATPFTPEDLSRIEDRMRDIVRRDEPITREVWDRDKAVAFFDDIGERYKAEYIGEIPPEEEISLYRQGNFVDLCVGPHLPSTGRLGQAFKLMNVAGAYWRGDPNNAQLQRVYGTAWPNRRRRSAAFSGTPRAGSSIASSRTTCAAGSTRPAMPRFEGRCCSTAACGKPRAIGRISARTCSSPRAATSGCSRSSR